MNGARRRVLAGLAGVAAWPLAAHSAEPTLAESVRRRLADAPVLRGRFEQKKTVAGFRNPIVSRGSFVVARDKGVLWETREPFASTLVVTRDRLLSRQADGRVDQRIDARDEPGLRAVNELLFALVSADLAALQSRFVVEGELVGAAGWRLKLVPRDAALGQWIKQAELEGERWVRRVHLVEGQGDASEIAFSDQQTAAALAPEEAARFE